MTSPRLTAYLKPFSLVTEGEALAALTAAGQILSAREVTEWAGQARGGGPHHDMTASKSMRALGRLADAGEILKIDRRADGHRYMQAGAWLDGRFGWATPAAAEAARARRQAHEDARITRETAGARNKDRLGAAIPSALRVAVYTPGEHDDVVRVELDFPAGDFEEFASRLDSTR